MKALTFLNNYFWHILDNYFWHSLAILQLIVLIYMGITKAPKIDQLSGQVFFVFAIVMMHDSRNQKLEERIKKLEDTNKSYEDGEI